MLQLFAPSQEFFAAVSEDNRLRVWDVVRANLSISAGRFMNSDSGAQFLHLPPNDRCLASRAPARCSTTCASATT